MIYDMIYLTSTG